MYDCAINVNCCIAQYLCALAQAKHSNETVSSRLNIHRPSLILMLRRPSVGCEDYLDGQKEGSLSDRKGGACT
jgi:hypothetical protein